MKRGNAYRLTMRIWPGAGGKEFVFSCIVVAKSLEAVSANANDIARDRWGVKKVEVEGVTLLMASGMGYAV